MKYVKFVERILNPSDEFTPIPFWFFNDEPDREKIRKQLKDYVEKGVNGIVLHPRIGIPETLSYLSEEYFEAVRFIVETAASLHMKVVLYDEGMYPSGSAHGMVVAANPEYASKGIILRDEPGNGEVIARMEDGRYLVYDFTGGTIRGIHFGEDDGEAGAPASADILNPDAVDLFIHLTHDRYYEHLSEYFGNTVIAFFTDEPSALGRNAGAFREWVKGLDQEIMAEGGTLEELAGLFDGEQNRTTAIYHKLIKKHLREIFYGRLSSWCEAHGIGLIGHPEASDDVEEQLYFQIPGQDLIMRRVVPKTGGLREFDSVQAKLAADIARHLGRRRNANECFGVCCREQIPWYFTAEDMKWYIDWLGFRGVNLYIPHAFYYSVEGARSGERPPDVGPNNIWWKHYRKFSDYMKRLSFLMTDSVNSAKVAVLCDNNRVPYTEIAPFYENQVEFNYLPVGLLADCHMEDGKLCIREYRYEAVVDPLGVLEDRLPASFRLSEKAEFGKVVASCEQKLLQQASVSCEQKVLQQTTGLLYSVEEVLGEMRWRSVWTAEQNYQGLRVTHLVKDGVDLYLFSNEGKDPLAVKWQLPQAEEKTARRKEDGSREKRKTCFPAASERTVNPLRVDLWNGKYVRIAAGTDIPLQLNPCETVLFVLDGGGISAEEPKAETCLGNWTDRFRLVEIVENQAVYETVYQAEQVDGTEYFIVQGEEMAECYCNGAFADVSFWNEHCLSIGSHLKPGENVIRLVFTGNAANIYTDAEIPFGLIRGRTAEMLKE